MVNKIQNHNSPALNTRQARPEKSTYEKVAENFEAQFIQHMLGEMRKTVPSSDSGAALDFYNSI
ncbi:MAG: hypothetical protein ACOCUH_03810, partial [Bacteriovoracia bacterium]